MKKLKKGKVLINMKKEKVINQIKLKKGGVALPTENHKKLLFQKMKRKSKFT